MEEIRKLIDRIDPADAAAGAEARRRWNELAKPLGSLGVLEDDLVRIAALTGSAELKLKPRTLLVFCADNGVVAQGVSQCGSSVTACVAEALGAGRSSVNPLAREADCTVLPVDMGILNFAGCIGVLDRRVQNGTGDISLGPAMSREVCLQAMQIGAELVKDQAEAGTRLLALGEMGIGNTTTSAAVAAALLELPTREAIGRGAGLSDEGLRRKRRAVEQALKANTPDPGDPIDVLSKVGGLDLAALCGAFIGAAASRIPVIADGLISTVAALCALRLCPAAEKALLLSHESAEPAAAAVREAIGLPVPIRAGLHLGEGSGALCLMPLLDMALRLYGSGQSFEKLGIEAYRPQD